MNMKLKREINELFQPLLGKKAWGAKVGWGSFVTIEFGARRLQQHHYHGDWHIWLYQCDWTLKAQTHEMAHSESQKGLMQTAIENLNDRELLETFFDEGQMATDFLFQGNLRLRCQPYADAEATEEFWMLFMPDKQVASLSHEGLKYERETVTSALEDRTLAPQKDYPRRIRFED